MKFMVYGAGTIGITYGWLLSEKHQVDFLGRKKESKNLCISFRDLRSKAKNYEDTDFRAQYISEIDENYDGIIVSVNRFQLKSILPHLKELKSKTRYFVFMQNNWNLQEEIGGYLSDEEYIIAFPSTVGGGRDEHGIEVIIFDEATRLGGKNSRLTKDFSDVLNELNIKTKEDNNIFDWLKVHYLQQSVTAGAIAENGSFQNFSNNLDAVKKMVYAFREGIEVCRLRGVNTRLTFPAYLFKLPVFLVAPALQKMFNKRTTTEMIINHMKKGFIEWTEGYKEILMDGRRMGLKMKVWGSYEKYLDKWRN